MMPTPTGRLRVGLDVRPLSGASGRRGVGTYIRGLLSGWPEGDDGMALYLFEAGPANGGLPEAPQGAVRVRLRRPRRGITLWDQAAWFPVMLRRRLAVFHSPFYAVPRLRPRGCAVVQTVHDLTPIRFPGAVSPRNERIFRANFRLARTADRIIVPSCATRDDVVERLGIPATRCVVIPEACDITAEEVARAADRIATVCARIGIERGRYLLHTGGHDRVKNLGRLLQAFAVCARDAPDLRLVLSGDHGRETASIMNLAARLGVMPRVRLPGWVPREDLIALYRGAAVVVYPSLSEGFGLPVLEAMTCGAPVVASHAGALPEVAGDACLLVDPERADAIADAARRCLEDADLAARLSEAGRRRAAGFSWKEAARRTVEVYREVAA